MALSLPYPNLNFVPLDVLTAEEMNQIVSNYTYISNQFPVASDNIDWTTMNSVGFYTQTAKATQDYSVAMIPNGAKFLALAIGYVQLPSNGAQGQRFLYNGTQSAAIWQDNPTNAVKSMAISNMGVFEKVAGVDIITFQGALNQTSVTQYYMEILVARIG